MDSAENDSNATMELVVMTGLASIGLYLFLRRQGAAVAPAPTPVFVPSVEGPIVPPPSGVRAPVQTPPASNPFFAPQTGVPGSQGPFPEAPHDPVVFAFDADVWDMPPMGASIERTKLGRVLMGEPARVLIDKAAEIRGPHETYYYSLIEAKSTTGTLLQGYVLRSALAV